MAANEEQGIVSYQPDVWLTGPVARVPAALQPAAHALLQTVEDIRHALEDMAEDDVWVAPGGAASIGFHLIHLAGATDRLCTAARGDRLTDAQKAARDAEKTPPSPRPLLAVLIDRAIAALHAAVDQLRAIDPATLADARPVGRAGLPSTVGGLLFHAAEHAQRHAGQIVTTAKIVRAGRN
jgi:DinB family protein